MQFGVVRHKTDAGSLMAGFSDDFSGLRLRLAANAGNGHYVVALHLLDGLARHDELGTRIRLDLGIQRGRPLSGGGSAHLLGSSTAHRLGR